MLSFIKDGVSARDAYQHAVSYVKTHAPDLEKNFVKSIGFGVISFIDRYQSLTKIFFQDGH
jgi:nucleosome binding factor SPN SPT16 subunit